MIRDVTAFTRKDVANLEENQTYLVEERNLIGFHNSIKMYGHQRTSLRAQLMQECRIFFSPRSAEKGYA